MKKRKFTIQKYSGMAGVFLFLHNNINAQAVYTDIEPDIIIQFDEETAGIDMDNNGTYDFAFLKTSGSYEHGTFSSTIVTRFRHRIWAGPEIVSNSIAGDYDYDSAGGGITYHPYALPAGTPINNDLSFQNWGFQIMAGGFYQSSFFIYYEGKWVPDIDNNFLGVIFKGDDDCFHYGWIRCTTAGSTKQLIIHDYAYESKCETGIMAGDKIGDTAVVAIESLNTLDADIYSFNKTIYIKTSNYENTLITVTNLRGQIILSQQLSNEFSVIDMSIFPSDLYIVKLKNEGKECIKKVVIN